MSYPTRSIERMVNYADTDAGGVVYYGRYLEFLEAGRMEYLQAIGCDAVECHRQGIFFAVREVHITYRAPARLGDLVRVISTVTEVTRAHMTFHAEVRESQSDRLLIEADVKCICMNPEGRLLPLPESLRTALQNPAESPNEV